MPCALVEMGYSTNYREDKRLNTPAYQEKLARGMANGICIYMGLEAPTAIE